MKRVIVRLANGFRPSRTSGALWAVNCAAVAHVFGGFGQQLNHIISGTISDCLGAQFMQSVPLLAEMSTDGFNTGFIASELGTALIGSAVLAIITGLVSSMRPKLAPSNACVAEQN
jgi:hypothetical protein